MGKVETMEIQPDFTQYPDDRAEEMMGEEVPENYVVEADYATDILAAIADTDDELDVFASDFESDFRFLKMKSYAYDEYAEVA